MERDSTLDLYFRILCRYEDVCDSMGDLSPYVSEVRKKQIVAEAEGVTITTVYRAMRHAKRLMSNPMRYMPG